MHKHSSQLELIDVASQWQRQKLFDLKACAMSICHEKIEKG